MQIFFDTEFANMQADKNGHRYLISIGCVAQDEREFYAELTDTYQASACEPFVHEAVLPHLQGGDARMTMDELTLRLGNWIESFNQPVKLVTDSLSWDWPWIQELFYLPGTWLAIDDFPDYFSPFCPSLYVVDHTTGLTDKDAERLIERLKR